MLRLGAGFPLILRSCLVPRPLAAPHLTKSLADQISSQSINDEDTRQYHSIMTSTAEPRIGVGVFVLNAEGKFVLGKRKGSHGASESLHGPGLNPFPPPRLFFPVSDISTEK